MVKGCDLQPDAREGQAGLHGVAERFVVPSKLGNASEGKEPCFGSVLESSKGLESDHVVYNLHDKTRKLQTELGAQRRISA